MPLSRREQRILAALEDQLNRNDPALADMFTHEPAPAREIRRTLSATRLGLLAVVLLVLVLGHPLAMLWGPAGVGLLTAGLVVPWVVVAARGAPRRQRVPRRRPDRSLTGSST
jgi:hypothetical protein